MIIVATKSNLEEIISTDKEIKIPTIEDYSYAKCVT